MFGENHCPPTVKSGAENTSENIERFIRPCVSRGEVQIYARPLTKPAKVFTSWNDEGYLFGNTGDYLVLRTDDLNDVYIVEKKIFELT